MTKWRIWRYQSTPELTGFVQSMHDDHLHDLFMYLLGATRINDRDPSHGPLVLGAVDENKSTAIRWTAGQISRQGLGSDFHRFEAKMACS